MPSHPTSPTCGFGAQFLLSSCRLCNVRAEELHFQLSVSQGADLLLFALSSPKPGSYPPTASPCALSCFMQPCPEQHQQSSPLHLVLSLLGENQESIQRVREGVTWKSGLKKGPNWAQHPKLWQGFISSTMARRGEAHVGVFGSAAQRHAQLLLASVTQWHVQSFFHFISAGGSFDFPCRLSASLARVYSCFSLLYQTYLI